MLIVDSSAGMASRTDNEDRMALARQRAAEVVGRLPEGGRVTVVAAADTANVLVSETDDRDAALEAIDGIEASQVPGDLTDAFALASALAARDSDKYDRRRHRCLRRSPCRTSGSAHRWVVEQVGATDANQAIAALSALRRAGGAQLDLFVAIANFLAGGGHAPPRGLRRRRARRRARPHHPGRPAVGGNHQHRPLVSVAGVEARLAGSDALATDDRAFAGVPAEETTRALLVGEGSAYLETVLAYPLPRLELYAVNEAGYEDALEEAAADELPYGLFVFDGVVPADPPPGPALYVDPDEDGAFGTVAGRIDGPLIDRTDPEEPLLRFVDLTTVHIGRAREIEPAAGMRAVVSTPLRRTPWWQSASPGARRRGRHRLRPGRVRPAAADRLPTADEQPG